MRRTLPIALAALLLATLGSGLPASAQQPAAGTAPQADTPNWPAGLERWNSDERDPKDVDPQEAERRGLTSPEVKESQMPPPTPQGTRPPEPTGSTAQDQASDLYRSLMAVRRAPPGLDGTPMPRPNAFASEPETEMEPSPAGNPQHLFPESYVE